MVIFKVKSGSFVLYLNRGEDVNFSCVYWITIKHLGVSSERIYYTSLFYPKKHAFALFSKMITWLFVKGYISY